MTPTSTGGICPTLTAADLIDSVPEIGALAKLSATTLLQLPGASLSFSDIIETVSWARQEVDSGACGVVVIQGTDTLEETSYLAELLWDRAEPLVFVGAMRGPMQISADGPANLVAAVRVAICSQSRNLGVMVVLDQTVHHASLVYKGHSTALNAFRSYGTQVLGHVVEDDVVLRPFRRRGTTFHMSATTPIPSVPIWHTYLGDDGSGFTQLMASNPLGVVIAATGVGHVSFGLADAIEDVAHRIPVILCTRIGEGGSMRDTYAFPGSEKDLLNRGAIVAGMLDVHKSRILLATLLAQSATKDRIWQEFAVRGAPI